MKNINALKALGISSVLLLFFFACCTKPEPKTTTPMAQIGLHLHTAIDTNMVDPSHLNVFYPDHNGRWEKLFFAQVYISNISFHSSTSGQWVVVPNSLILKREENEEYTIASVPADNYDDVRFTIGLNSALNSGSPSGYSQTSGVDTVLSANENFMYFGTGEGYKFLTLGGVVDTTASHNGTNLLSFNYAVGGTGDTTVVTMPSGAFTLAPNIPAVQYIHIICDYGKLIQGIQMGIPANRTGSTYGTVQEQSVATSIWNNIVNMFTYECATPNGTC